MVSILQVYVPFKLNFIQHILFMPITTKAINFFFYLCFCFYRVPLIHPLANRGNAAAFSSRRGIFYVQAVVITQKVGWEHGCVAVAGAFRLHETDNEQAQLVIHEHTGQTQQFAPTINWLEDTLCIVVYPLNIPKCSAGPFQHFRSIPSI